MFWPFPVFRNYMTSDWVDTVFREFAEASDLRLVASDKHYVTVACGLGALKFWSANRFYAWANEGEYVTPNGKRFVWSDEMPSRWSVRRMRQALRRCAPLQSA